MWQRKSTKHSTLVFRYRGNLVDLLPPSLHGSYSLSDSLLLSSWRRQETPEGVIQDISWNECLSEKMVLKSHILTMYSVNTIFRKGDTLCMFRIAISISFWNHFFSMMKWQNEEIFFNLYRPLSLYLNVHCHHANSIIIGIALLCYHIHPF